MDRARRFLRGDGDAGSRDLLLAGLRADPRITAAAIEAIGRVPRERFVDPADHDVAYEDAALEIGPAATISAPSMVGEMLTALGVHPGMTVLEVGAGSGYAAACLAEMGAAVVGLEILEDLAGRAQRRLDELGYGDRVTIHTADGAGGWPAGAPYDGVLVSAAIEAVPKAWLDQVAEGGCIVFPEAGAEYDVLVRLSQEAGGWRREDLGLCRFVRIR